MLGSEQESGDSTLEWDLLTAGGSLDVNTSTSLNTGIGATIANVAGHSDFYAYSRGGQVWPMLAAVAALSDTRINLCAHEDVTLAFLASVANRITRYSPTSF